MESEKGKLFTGEGDVTVRIFKAIFISLTLATCATLIHLDHNITIHTNSYIFTASLVEATEQLQDAISLILSNYYVGIDAELAWRNCSGSVLNGWGEIQDAVEHVMMNQRGDQTSQIVAAEGFIDSCLDDLDKVEATAADKVRAMLLMAKVYLSGRGAFLTTYHDEIWNRVVMATCNIILGNLLCIVFCGIQLFFWLYMFQKLFKYQ